MGQTILNKSTKKPMLLKISLGIIFFFLILMVIGIALLNGYINDKSITVEETLISKGDPQKLLAIFAHPDDEIMVAGTLHKLAEDGVDITSLYLTRGEAGPTGNLVPQEKLGAERTKEMKEVAKILEINQLQIFDYPDGGLQNEDPAVIKKTITKAIQKSKPSIIITFDDKLGLYGHSDHLLTGKYVKEVLVDDAYTVRHLYQMTLPQPMIDTALKISTTFKERYPKNPEDGLPKPTVAIKMASEAKEKKAVVEAHKTQWQVTGDVQPLHDKIPYWLYYRIFDREYFTKVELNSTP
ncbi:PIG-L deacetylase family protein [Rossellomorea aquimaris]|uniref:PIG-L deacetylase family protein n=1 Tax=Rossellomorea aquimaris TaxID=189382 RepID=UPI0007D04443|nr:PIG-L family deacetylase [Rossellomorea aquimaris]